MFQDLVVLELASVLAGPLTGSFFSELGARVIKIENPLTKGDITRQWKLESEDPDCSISAYYASANYDKEIYFLNVGISSDYEKVKEFVKVADIVIANYKSDSAKRFKLDYESLSKLNPKLVYASISGYGDDNPKPAFDMILQAECSYMSMTGESGRPPSKIPVAIIDILAAHHLKQAILCALLRRERDGSGSCVSVSLYDAAIGSLVNQATNYLMSGQIAQRMGSRHPNIAPYGDSFMCNDGKYLILAIGTDKQFESLAKLFSIDVSGFETNVKRLKKRDELCELIADKILMRNLSYWEEEFSNDKIPFSPILNIEETLSTPEAQKRLLECNIEGYSTIRTRTAYI